MLFSSKKNLGEQNYISHAIFGSSKNKNISLNSLPYHNYHFSSEITLKKETFTEESFAISRIFGKIAKVRSREKSQKQSFAKVCSRKKCEKESLAKVNFFKKNLNFSFRIIHKALSFNKKNNTRLNGAVKLV